jgi:CHASE2 domain-containing sensor protein
MNWRGMFRQVTLILSLAGAVCLVVAGAAGSGLLDPLELGGYDWLMHTRGFQPPPGNIVVVDFDEDSVAALPCYPVSRATLADVLETVRKGQPRVIGLDILLGERRCGEADAEKRLAEAIGRARNVVLVGNFASEQLLETTPLPEFDQRALDVAYGNMPVDTDGFVRRIFVAVRTPERTGLSFPTAVAGRYLGQMPRPGRPGAVRLGEKEIPLDGLGPNTILIAFWNAPAARMLPVAQLLANGFDASILKDKIVLVGQSSSKGRDLFSTPLYRFRKAEAGGSLTPGTEVHAAAIEAFLGGTAIRAMGTPWTWGLNLLFTALVLAVLLHARPGRSLLVFLAGMLAAYLVAQYFFNRHQMWVRFVSTEVSLVLALPAGLGYRYVHERRMKALAEAERRQLMGLFERYVSPEVSAQILQRRAEIVLAGEERVATVLFSDIRSFTALTAGKASAQVLAWLNRYLTAMSEVIRANGGFLNKFIGDGIMVLFGVPLSESVEKDACRAVRAALQMLESVEGLNARRGPDQPHLRIGIGLHTGPLTAGNVGSRDRLEYSVIGETVNLASRLESLTKEFKTGIVMSPQTRELVRECFETAPLGDAEVRGFTGKIPLYTVRASVPAEVKP